jgi:ABC-2 type transport system ATP-binding protein
MTAHQVQGPAIHVQGLEKSYKTLKVLRGVDFDVARGSIFALLGSNGAGKTTVVKILSTLLKAHAGTASVNGFDVATQAADVRKSISLTGQFAAVDEILSGRENLVLVAQLRHLKDPGTIADDLLERFALTDAAAQKVSTYSGGLRRRLDIAMSLIGNPRVIILDEPTAGLDPKQIIETRELIKELAGDHTIILSTHILPEVSQTCQRVVIINKGRVVAVDTPDNLTARLRGSETIYLQIDAAGPDPSAVLTQVDGVRRVAEADRRDGVVAYEIDSETGRDVRRDLARTVISSGWGLLEMRPMRMSLEDIFLSLTTEEAPTASVEEPVHE